MPASTDDSKAQFSVIIPTYACPGRLRACLEGLGALDFSRDQFEVVVSDEGSPTSEEPSIRAGYSAVTGSPAVGRTSVRERA